MKLLVASEDPAIVGLAEVTLRREGHLVLVAIEGPTALQLLRTEQPEVAILDAELPLIDGISVCRLIGAGATRPSVILVAVRTEQCYAEAFAAGADDAFTKPITRQEFKRRIAVNMRRVVLRAEPQRRSARSVSVADLVVDPSTFSVTKNGQPILLTWIEFCLLYVLAAQAGYIVPADDLAHVAWRTQVVDPARRLKPHISHIRRKLKTAGGDTMHIGSIPRNGYMLTVTEP